jgi:uncharacterized UPF0160 family protein
LNKYLYFFYFVILRHDFEPVIYVGVVILICKNPMIGTHPSKFHLDDVASTFLIRTALPKYAEAKIIRTEDQKQLAKCDIVYDVGGVYCHDKMRYDHHQRGFGEVFSAKWADVKLSAFGLLYRHFGKQLLTKLSPNPLSADDLYTPLPPIDPCLTFYVIII